MKIRMNWRVAGMASGAAAVVVGVALALAAPASATPPGPTGHKQTICHRTDSNTNPYVVETVDVASIFKTNGHNSHDGPVWNPNLKDAGIKWGDIIPAFTYTSTAGQTTAYAGKNLGGLGGIDGTTTGQQILANNCQIPTVSTTTSTSTSTPTTTSTSTSTPTSGTSTSTSTPTSGTSTSSSINVSGTSSASTTPQSTSSVLTTPTSSQVSSTTPGSQSSHGSAHNGTHASNSTSPWIQVLGTSSRLATTSGTASPAAVITSGAPSATAHTGQSTGILPYLILLGGLGMLLASALLRRGNHRV